MCGICDLYLDGTQALVGRMARLPRHRGPEDEGLEQGRVWALGFRRLSVIDVSALGHQPMRRPDGTFWLAFNGEIYLRRDLERAGERFQGGSAAEVLVRLLARRGVHALSQLNGMFALALVDTEARTFLLARCRLGVKPLYYKIEKDGLRFTSELKALLAWPDADAQIEPAAVVEYLGLGYLPSETCIFAGYVKLPAAHILAGALDAPQQAHPAPCWRLVDNRSPGPLPADELQASHDLLLHAAHIRRRSDVPVGVFLSGGIDSDLVATLAAGWGSNKDAGSPVPRAVYSKQGIDSCMNQICSGRRRALEE